MLNNVNSYEKLLWTYIFSMQFLYILLHARNHLEKKYKLFFTFLNKNVSLFWL